jgi:hypothetical protein
VADPGPADRTGRSVGSARSVPGAVAAAGCSRSTGSWSGARGTSPARRGRPPPGVAVSDSQRISRTIVKTRRCSRVWEAGGDQGVARRTELVDAFGPVVADVDPPVRVGDLCTRLIRGPPLSSGLETGASGRIGHGIRGFVRNYPLTRENLWAIPGLNLQRLRNCCPCRPTGLAS